MVRVSQANSVVATCRAKASGSAASSAGGEVWVAIGSDEGVADVVRGSADGSRFANAA